MFRYFTIATVFASVALFAAEDQVQMKDLPQAVQKTVKEQTQNAKVRGISTEAENGKTAYEVETTVNGKSRDLVIDANGTVIEVEEAVTLESIPEAARSALNAKAGSSGKVLKVESVTRGSVVSYEAVVQKNGRKSEVAVNADGSMAKED